MPNPFTSATDARRATGPVACEAVACAAGAGELVDEVPVAMVYDGVTLAVLMASPQDLVDFAVGFTLTEGIAARPPEVRVVRHRTGIECRMALDGGEARALRHRQRALTAGSSCGVCGVRGLAQAVRVPPEVAESPLTLDADAIRAAAEGLRAHQPLHDRTHAAHAAGLFVPGRGTLRVREDVGRHNALDKLVGALRREGADVAAGAVVLTSRVSIEMVQKAAVLGAPVVIAVSAPTALAVRVARAAGITLVGNARRGRFDVFTHPHRIGARPVRPVPPARAAGRYAADPTPSRATTA